MLPGARSLSALSATFSYNGDSAWYVQVSGVANAAVDVPALLDSELKLEAPFLTRLVSPQCMLSTLR